MVTKTNANQIAYTPAGGVATTIESRLRNHDQVLANVEGNLNFTTLVNAQTPVADSDLLILRQGDENKKLPISVVRTELATDAVEAANLAVSAKVLAESARDAAIIQAGVYVDEPTGRAAVADGQAFKVQGSGDVAAFEYRRTNGTASVLIAVYPSATRVEALRIAIDAAGSCVYVGAGPVYPLATDSVGRVILGFDAEKNNIIGPGLVTASELNEVLNGLQQAIDYYIKNNLLSEYGMAAYKGSGPVYPFFTDQNGRVVLGLDTSKNELVGPFPGQGTLTSAQLIKATLQPIAEPTTSKAINHLLFYGQSLSVGATATTILSASQPYSNITFNGGPRAWSGGAYDFTAFKPLVEDAVNPAPDGSANRGETTCSGAANYAITLAIQENGYAPSDHVILASTAGHGGYRIDQLYKGSAWYTSTLLPHISGAKALNPDYALHAFGWIQGENDVNVTDYATYRSRLSQLQADIEADAKAISAQSSPVYCITYQLSWGIKTSTAQAFAQLDLAQKNTKFILATPCYHLPYAGDKIHLTNVGYKWLGAYFGRAYKQLVIDGKRPKFLSPVSATRRGAVIRVKFDVPVLPMVLDVTTLAPTTDYGFVVTDGATTTVISSVATDGSDVVITLTAAPVGAVKVRYALDYLGAGLTVVNGASGNLRDSTPDTITISGVLRPLYHVCPHFELSVITLGE